MKYFRQLRLAFVSLLICTLNLHAQQIDSVLRGVYLFGEPKVDFQQMRNSLHLNTFQYTTELYPASDQGVLTNSANLKVINQPNFYSVITQAQRMIYEAKREPAWMNHFLISSNTRKPDTIIYLKDATIYFYDKDISRLKGILK